MRNESPKINLKYNLLQILPLDFKYYIINNCYCLLVNIDLVARLLAGAHFHVHAYFAGNAKIRDYSQSIVNIQAKTNN